MHPVGSYCTSKIM